MCYIFTHDHHMSRMIQIRNVPDSLHRRLEARAAMAGMSLSDYLLEAARKLVERPTPTELRAQLEARTAVKLSEEPAVAVRRERDRR
jgi:plasmid stability protein